MKLDYDSIIDHISWHRANCTFRLALSVRTTLRIMEFERRNLFSIGQRFVSCIWRRGHELRWINRSRKIVRGNDSIPICNIANWRIRRYFYGWVNRRGNQINAKRTGTWNFHRNWDSPDILEVEAPSQAWEDSNNLAWNRKTKEQLKYK